MCSYTDGTAITNCQSLVPTVSGTDCNNLIKSLTYVLRYDSTVGGVIEAGVQAVFFNQLNYSSNPMSIQQEFKMVYIPKSVTINNFELQYTKVFSGNPGYLIGKPIQAGYNVNSQIK